MNKIPYDASRDSLYKPGKADDFFRDGLDTSDHAVLCAEMARLAYVTQQDKLEKFLARAKFDLPDPPLGYETKGTQVFIAATRPDSRMNTLVVAFRGTERTDPCDLIADIDLRKRQWQDAAGNTKGRVHSGFAKALLKDNDDGNILIPIQKTLESLISEYDTVLITGHSLGAALATLTAAYFQPIWGGKIQLFTFGSPLVGNKEFSEQMKDIHHKRFVNCCDAVTRVPKWFGYTHSGELNYIDKQGNRHCHMFINMNDDEISEFIAKDRKAARMKYRKTYDWLNRTSCILLRDFADHSPINYLSGVAGLRRETLQSFSFEEIKNDELKQIKEVRSDANDTNLVGLAFSGGGIRSATFGLGVLEALKEKKILEKVDYLSTVSGGGYIGSWLSANCARKGNNWSEMPSGIDDIENCKDWQESVDHLRRYSNYLSPKLGFLSVDTWSMLTSWLRNTLLIQLMVIVGIATILLLPRALLPLISIPTKNATCVSAAFISFGFIFTWILYSLHKANPEKEKCSVLISLERKLNLKKSYIKNIYLVFTIIISCLWISSAIWMSATKNITYGSAIKILISIKNIDDRAEWGPLISPLLLSYLSFVVFSFISSRKNIVIIKNFQNFFVTLHHFLVALPATIVLHLLFAAILYTVSDWAGIAGGEILAFTWVPPMVACSLALAINVLIGMQGVDSFEIIREWWSRFGAWLAIYGTAWMLIVVAAFYGPLWVEILYYEGSWKAIGSGWVGTTIAGLLAGKSASTNGSDGENFSAKIKQYVAKISPFVFIAGFVIVVSWVLHLFIVINTDFSTRAFNTRPFEISQRHLLGDGSPILEAKQIYSKIEACYEDLPQCISRNANIKYATSSLSYDKKTNEFIDSQQREDREKSYSPTYSEHWKLIYYSDYYIVICFLGLSWIVGLILSRRVDINEFSLNAFYRDRLARCYLGASNDSRSPHPFTGFSEKDDILLNSLRRNSQERPCRPFHILNCALNLGGSSDLSLHTRQSAVFTLTPLYSGSSYIPKAANGKPKAFSPDGKPLAIGYRPTDIYGGSIHQPTLGQAVSVSGAAASPNMGYHTSLPVAFLMTLFNARLGWWFPHPNKNHWDNPSPPWSLRYLRYELFGTANETDDFLSISDGGHFENLGGYELIKRRCKVIIISDGECDPKLQFEGLANLIRLSDVDLDATINIDIRAIQPVGDEKWSRSRCSVGKIHYRKTERFPDDPVDGWLIYIKAAMNGHEGTSVMQYKATHPDFPHETTGNQFYTEDQFESYRSLGRDITEKVFGKWDKEGIPINQNYIAISKNNRDEHKSFDQWSLEEISEALYDIFFPELSNASAFTHHADKLMEIWDQLREDDNLKGLDSDLGLPSNGPAREIFYKCSEMIQLMESVYLDLNLEDTWDHIDNRGWMELFIKWANSPQLKQIWNITNQTYGIRFQSFWDRKLIK